MPNVHPGDVYVKDNMTWPIYVPASDTFVNYDFVADGGYTLGDLLDIAADGQVQIFASTSPRYETYADMVVNGTEISIDGTGDAHAVLDMTDAETFLFICNLPNTPGVVYYFKAVASKNTG